ncbi:hypothetical protein GCM10010431_21810 [Streptomyces kunmingensis]
MEYPVPSQKALVRRPGPRIADGLVTHVERTPVDAGKALTQWQGYVAALEAHGWETFLVEPADDCPDAVFVEDTVVVFRNVALITRPGAESRRGETPGVEEAVARLGCSVNWIWEPGTLDGGDVLKVGDTLYAGRGGRTNAAGVQQLRAVFEPLGARGARAGQQGAAPEVRGDGAARRDGRRTRAAGGSCLALPAFPAGAGGGGRPCRPARR